MKVMVTEEWEMRSDLEPLVQAGFIRMVLHEGWTTAPELLEEKC